MDYDKSLSIILLSGDGDFISIIKLIRSLTATENFGSKNFDFSNFFNDMQILENTSTFSIPDMITTITTSKKLNNIVENIDAKDKRYEDFLIQKDKIKKTEEHLEQLNNKFTELLNFYGEPEEKVDLRIYLIEVNNAIKKIKTQLTKDIEKEKAKVRASEATAKAKKAKV